MLEVINLVLTSGEVKRNKHEIPQRVDVDLDIADIKSEIEDGAILSFTYKVNYTPDVGSVTIKGRAYCRDTPSNIKRLLAGYKKKKPPIELLAGALNMINSNVGLNCVFLMRPFNLVPHFVPPPIYTEEDLKQSFKVGKSEVPPKPKGRKKSKK